MAESCEFGEFKNEMIRDQLVIDICDERLTANL